MLEPIISTFGLPILGGLLLILLAVVWYRLGKRAGQIALLIGGVAMALRLYRENAVLKEEAKKNARNSEAISRANDIRRDVRNSNRNGELFKDDGFRRD